MKEKRVFNKLIQSKGVVKEKVPDSDSEDLSKPVPTTFVPEKTTESFMAKVDHLEDPADQAALAVFVQETSAQG